MHKNIDKIKKLEGPPKIVKNLFNKEEINKFLKLYNDLPTTVHNKKQNVIKKRWLKNFNEELENLFYKKVNGVIGEFKMDNLKDEKNENILGLFYRGLATDLFLDRTTNRRFFKHFKALVQ